MKSGGLPPRLNQVPKRLSSSDYFYSRLMAALRRFGIVSLPRIARLSLSWGLAGAQVVAMRMRLKMTAGFSPVSSKSWLSVSCRLSGVKSLCSNDSRLRTNNSLSLAGSSFLSCLLLVMSSKFGVGSAKKKLVSSGSSAKYFRRSWTRLSTDFLYASSKSAADSGQ